MSVLVNFLFLISDYVLIPNLIKEAFLLRCIIALLGIIFYLSSKKITTIFWFETVFLLWISLSAFLVTLIITYAGGPGSVYTGGLNIVILTALVFFPISRTSQVLSVIGGWFPYYLLVFFYLEYDTDIKNVIIHSFINASTILLALLLQYMRKKNHLAELQLRYELKEERKKLREVDKLKSRFFTNVSHEFRTPLTLIMGPLKSILKKKIDTNIQQELFLILQNSNKLYKLINELLDFSKIEANKLSIELKPVKIVYFTRYFISLFDSISKEKNIKIHFNADKLENLVVKIDINKYEKIINNILSNALKYTSKDGHIYINCDVDKNSNFKISIADTGKGIPSNETHHIFDVFYQVDGKNNSEYEGTGIGLALAKELIELHNGTIHVTSELGKGTTFMINIPDKEIFIDEINEIEYKNSEKSISNQLLYNNINDSLAIGNKINKNAKIILIVEDNKDMRVYLKYFLHDNYYVLEATNGEEGLLMAKKYQPDLIVSDVMMPKMDGFTFCNQLKNTEQICHIPIILLTAKASQESKFEGLESRADEYMFKPFDSDELLIRISNLIEQRKQLRSKYQKSSYDIEIKSVTNTSIDEEFLKKAINIVEQFIDDQSFDTIIFAKEMGVSRSLLNIKIKALTDFSTRMFIRNIRLKRAAQLFLQKTGNTTQICYSVGFSSLSHFIKVFKEQYGVTPSKYIENLSNMN